MRIKSVERFKRLSDSLVLEVIGKRDKIEVIPRRVPTQDENALDAQHLCLCRELNAEPAVTNVDRFQGGTANELADAGFYPIEAPKDEHRAPNASCFPSRDGLKVGQDLVEPVRQVGKNMVGIKGDAVLSKHGGCGSPYQHGIRDDPLQVSGGGKDSLPLRKRRGALWHNASRSGDAGRKGRSSWDGKRVLCVERLRHRRVPLREVPPNRPIGHAR